MMKAMHLFSSRWDSILWDDLCWALWEASSGLQNGAAQELWWWSV